MARQTNRLTDKGVKALKAPGMYADGAGLYLAIKSDGGKSWLFKYRFAGKRREMGLGGFADVSLVQARGKVRDARQLLDARIDPIEDRKASAAALAATESLVADTMTLGAFAKAYIDEKRHGWRGRDTEKSWRRSFDLYAAPITDKPISEIDTDAVLSVLRPIWLAMAESATKTRQRIEEVLDAARAAQHRTGENPARWKGHLVHFLPKPQKLQRGHHPALPHERVGQFMADLAKRQGVSARALEWTVLTVARESMTLEARRGEVDRAKAIWTVPAGRMKMATDFRVPLSPQALAVLDRILPEEGYPSDLIFPGPKPGRPLSDAAMDMMMREIAPGFVPHGLRSTFRDWAGDETEFPRELAEEALAHVVGDDTERAYRRRDALERRRKLMEAWGGYCAKPPETGGQ